MRFLTCVTLFFICSTLFGQVRQYQNLLDTALSGQGAMIVCSKTIANIQLDKTEMLNYYNFHRDIEKKQLDTIMFAQIVRNSKLADTTQWKDDEVKGLLLVDNREGNVSTKYAIKKLKLTDKKGIMDYKKKVDIYNSTDSYNRNLYYFSRPVYDDSKHYAIVQCDNAHGGLGGGGAIFLYQLRGDTWVTSGIIVNWKY